MFAAHAKSLGLSRKLRSRTDCANWPSGEAPCRRRNRSLLDSGHPMLTTERPAIPIAKPELGEEEAAAARDAILSGWVTQGPRVAAFEEAFAAAVQASHACAVSNCTTALHLALHALGVK